MHESGIFLPVAGESVSAFVILEKAVHCSVCFIARESFNLNPVEGTEDIVFNFGIGLLQLPDEFFDFLALRGAFMKICIVFREAAGTLQKFELIRDSPADNCIFLDAVHRPDQFHAREVLAVCFRDDGLQLGTVEHGHDGCLDHIIQMMAEGYFIAAEELCLVVEMAAAHSRTQVAWRF